MTNPADLKALVEKLFAAGAHYGYAKSRRHPSAAPFLFGVKNRVEIFDLEKTVESLEKAEEYVKALAATGKQLLFVGGKLEARRFVAQSAASANQPFVASRWVGGTLSNFGNIRGRVEKMVSLSAARETGELSKYTKKERLMIDREVKRLEEMFGGLRSMSSIPGALFIIDPKHEKNAVAEAIALRIPIIALANSDCDINRIQYPIPANDSSVASIDFITQRIANAYREGAVSAPARTETPSTRPARPFAPSGRTTSDRRPTSARAPRA